MANWKTTALGIAALFTAAAHMIAAVVSGDFNTAIMTDAPLIITGFLGLVAKDHNVTGGTTPNN